MGGPGIVATREHSQTDLIERGRSLSGPVLSRLWERWGNAVAWLATIGVSVMAIHRMRYALPHAVTRVEHWSAVNVAYRHDELTRFFDGASIYHAEFGRLTYPPATYVFLWPILGWLPLDSARVLFVATNLTSAAIIALVAYRLADRHPQAERFLIVALIFASYPLQISVFLGHMPAQVVALVAIGALILTRAQPRWLTDVVASACLSASLVKPTLAPPLIAAVLIATWRWRPVLLTGALYVAVAVIASTAQPTGFMELHLAWLNANTAHAVAAELAEALPNLHNWLSWVGLGRWGPVASILALAAYATWAWRRRWLDVWLLLGTAALVARLWSYHRPYDDIVILLSAIALLRVARGPDRRLRVAAAVLFAATCAALLTPAWALYNLEGPTKRLVYAAQTTLWVTLLIFLLMSGRWAAAARTVSRE